MGKDKGYGLLWMLAAQAILLIFFLAITPRPSAEGLLYRSAVPVTSEKVLSRDDNGNFELKHRAGYPCTESTGCTTSVSGLQKNYIGTWEVDASLSQATGTHEQIGHRVRLLTQRGYYSNRSPTYGVTVPAIIRNRWIILWMRPYVNYTQYYLITFKDGTRTWALVGSAITRTPVKGRVAPPVGYYQDRRTVRLLTDREREAHCITDRNVLEDNCLGNALDLYSGQIEGDETRQYHKIHSFAQSVTLVMIGIFSFITLILFMLSGKASGRHMQSRRYQEFCKGKLRVLCLHLQYTLSIEMKRAEKGWKEMIWSSVVTILAATVLLCGCDGTISPTAANSMTRESALSEGMEYRSEAPAPEIASESLPETTVKPELPTDTGTPYPIEYGTDMDIIFFVDLDHDGESERIIAGLADLQAPGGQHASFKILAGELADSPAIWEHDYSVAHVGWTMSYLYRESGADYLMEYSPYVSQGCGAYSIRIFYIGPDKEIVEIYSHAADFALQQEDRAGFFGDPDALIVFADMAKGYIKNSLLLVSTDQRYLAHSIPERPAALDHNDSFFIGSWNVTGKWNRRETIEYMLRENWMAAEGIPLLCISCPSGDTVGVQLKNRNHFHTTSNPVIDQLLADMAGRNWTSFPDREPPPGPSDVVLSVYRKEGTDVFMSCC